MRELNPLIRWTCWLARVSLIPIPEIFSTSVTRSKVRPEYALAHVFACPLVGDGGRVMRYKEKIIRGFFLGIGQQGASGEGNTL